MAGRTVVKNGHAPTVRAFMQSPAQADTPLSFRAPGVVIHRKGSFGEDVIDPDRQRLRTEKRRLHEALKTFERDFEKSHGRPVREGLHHSPRSWPRGCPSSHLLGNPIACHSNEQFAQVQTIQDIEAVQRDYDRYKVASAL